jgi:hypothetical protein
VAGIAATIGNDRIEVAPLDLSDRGSAVLDGVLTAVVTEGITG